MSECVNDYGSSYPNAEIGEEYIKLNDLEIPTNWIEVGTLKVQGDWSAYHRVTLTVFVKDLMIKDGARFEGVPSADD